MRQMDGLQAPPAESGTALDRDLATADGRATAGADPGHARVDRDT